MAASSLSAAIAAADRLFRDDSAATGAVFDTAALGGPDRDGRFAAFARRDGDAVMPARLVGLFPTDDAATAALARDRRGPAFSLGVPAAGVLIPGSALYRTDADGNPVGSFDCPHAVGCPHDI